jgi:hypothetical protein
MEKNEWDGCHPPVEEIRIDQVQAELGVVFSDDYKECVTCCHGGRPANNAFALYDPDIGRMESCIGTLLTFAEADNENIIQTQKRLGAFLPKGAIPVADDGGGDFACLDYSSGESPTIGYWNHGEVRLIPLAQSFSEFLDMLYGETSEFLPTV